MKKFISDVRGFSVGTLMVILLIIGVVGFTGYAVYSQQDEFVDDSSSSVVDKQPTVADVPNKVETAGDLTDMEKVLNGTETDSDLSALDADLETL